MLRHRLLAALVAAAAPAAAGAQGKLVPLGDAFDVPAGTLHDQLQGAVATDGARLFYVWAAGGDVAGRLFDAQGPALGGEFQVNTGATDGNQDEPAVAYGADGSALVAWNDRSGADGEAIGVFARRFGRGGAPVGPVFQVNETWQASQWGPWVAARPGGGWVVAWSGNWDGDAYFRVLEADGSFATGDVRANSHTSGAQVDPTVAVADDGTIFVAFVEKTGFLGAGSGNNVFGRVFAPDGTPLVTPEFPLTSTTGDGDQWEPRASAQGPGRFAVAWHSIGTDGSGAGVYLRRFATDGAPLGPEERVNETTAGDQTRPHVAAAADGRFVVAWEDASSGVLGVRARRYDAAGVALGGELEPLPAGAAQLRPRLALSADGERVTVVLDQEGAGLDVRARRFLDLAAPATYCVGKPNHAGCTASVAATGTPSASAGAGFVVSATGTLSNGWGMLFYGTEAHDAPFQGGTLCVRPPLRRTPPQPSAGNPPPNDCSGTFALDFAAWAATGADPSLVAGQSVFAQVYYRDLQASFATALSNALAFTLVP